ncbi:hypothetical protein DID80_07765 [Candidatus Marinamargulisbacteria bacterium SCGC AAA071-K20]|nr:hypothetical protein DID80_07765 [Candidatus Marinamargulisbacteria bacterium SCGC AAA071-K20]
MILSVNSGIGSSVGLFNNGKLIVCLQEERFTRIKNYMGFPQKSLDFILNTYVKPEEIKHIALCNSADHQITTESFYKRYDDAFEDAVDGKTFDRYTLQNALSKAPVFNSIYKALKRNKHLLKNRMDVKKLLELGFSIDIMRTVGHHDCHAGAVYYGLAQDQNEPYLVFTADGGGDDITTAVWKGENGDLSPLATSNCYSLGNMYSMVTHFLGFKAHEHEYKLMGLAPYVNPKYAQKYAEFFEKFLGLIDDDTVFFNYERMEHRTFAKALLDQFKNDRFDNIAAGLQLFSERISIRWIKGCIKKYGISKILGSGGTFMNVKINKLIAELPEVTFVDVFPSCGDESNIFGAYYITDRKVSSNTSVSRLTHYTTGSLPSPDLASALMTFKDKISFEVVDDVNKVMAEYLAEHKLIARCTGPMEFGARALGNRSILANPSDLKNVSTINRAVKKRDFWMPFAPIVLDSRKDDYLNIPESIKTHGSPYMMFATDTKEDKRDDMICAIHQGDFTARPEIIDSKRYCDLYEILSHFNDKTGIGVLLNTSYNLHGYPIVENSHQAIEVFVQTELDFLVIDSTVIRKRP